MPWVVAFPIFERPRRSAQVAHLPDQHLCFECLCLSFGGFGGEDGDLRCVTTHECRYTLHYLRLYAKSTVSDALRRVPRLVLLLPVYWIGVESLAVSRMEIRGRQEGAVDGCARSRYGTLCRTRQFTHVLDSGLLLDLLNVVEEWQTQKT